MGAFCRPRSLYGKGRRSRFSFGHDSSGGIFLFQQGLYVACNIAFATSPPSSLSSYAAAVERGFGSGVDYGQIVKTNAAIRCTPAMEAGVTNSPWTVANLVEMIEG